jgi:GTP diphosphokinase / guanosine-3',5'-bis(diphosphate) 3'-diphosphatase
VRASFGGDAGGRAAGSSGGGSGMSAVDGVDVPAEEAFGDLQRVVALHCPDADRHHLERVYRIADECHRGQVRRSGDAYVVHAVTVARYVAEWELSADCVYAARLHDVAESGCDPQRLRPSVGDRVVDLIEAIGGLDDATDVSAMLADTDPYARRFATEVLAVKLADRLHNARTWRFVPRAKRRLKARQTLDVLAPAAAMLGLTALARNCATFRTASWPSLRYRRPV